MQGLHFIHDRRFKIKVTRRRSVIHFGPLRLLFGNQSSHAHTALYFFGYVAGRGRSAGHSLAMPQISEMERIAGLEKEGKKERHFVRIEATAATSESSKCRPTEQVIHLPIVRGASRIPFDGRGCFFTAKESAESRGRRIRRL